MSQIAILPPPTEKFFRQSGNLDDLIWLLRRWCGECSGGWDGDGEWMVAGGGAAMAMAAVVGGLLLAS